jgi:hypothetical protein
VRARLSSSEQDTVMAQAPPLWNEGGMGGMERTASRPRRFVEGPLWPMATGDASMRDGEGRLRSKFAETVCFTEQT